MDKQLGRLGITTPKVHWNLKPKALLKKALERKEGVLSSKGAIRVTTGKYTGRSPNDRFIADSPKARKLVNWGKVNVAISEEHFDQLYNRIREYLSKKKEVFAFDGVASADKRYAMSIHVINEFAYQNLFMQHMLRKGPQCPNPCTVICAPGCKADPKKHGTRSEAFVLLHLERRIVLIGGTKYSGEMKKSLFAALNYLLPPKGMFPMHSSANVNREGNVALFFGLSGTGKTTLSMDPKRMLIGDDEIVWSDKGLFNIEGGSYAKCIKLTEEREPLIYRAIRDAAIVENVTMDPVTHTFDFNDASITQNTRAAFPLSYVEGVRKSGVCGHPESVIFLTADAFGVLPPVARLDTNQALYHFLAGYTSKLAGTERGIVDPIATFSFSFGEPFMPRKPMVYLNLLKKKLQKHKPRVFLVNTGWQGGPYGVGKRIDLGVTRCIVRAIIDGKLDDVQYRHDSIFNFSVPKTCPCIAPHALDPRNGWSDKKAYDKKAKALAKLFRKNMGRFKEISPAILHAGP